MLHMFPFVYIYIYISTVYFAVIIFSCFSSWQMIKRNIVSVISPRSRVRPRIRNIHRDMYNSYQSSCRIIVASRSTGSLPLFFLFFFYARPPASRPPPVFSRPYVCLSLFLPYSPSYYVLRRYEPLLLSGSDRRPSN